jgi:hypothetical protein
VLRAGAHAADQGEHDLPPQPGLLVVIAGTHVARRCVAFTATAGLIGGVAAALTTVRYAPG